MTEFNSSCEGRLGGYIKNNLRILRLMIDADWDAIILVTGLNGDGKTTFVKTASFYLDPNTSKDNWAYSAEQFEAIVDRPNIRKGTNVIWDESDDLSGHWANKMMFAIKRKFKRIRSLNLIIWLITPTLFDINRYFIRRINCVIDVYANPTLNAEGTKIIPNRGYIRFFGKEKKRILYFKGKKEFDNMYAIMPDFSDTFSPPPPQYPISRAELDFIKDEATKNLISEVSGVNPLPKYRQECILRFERWLIDKNYRRVSNSDLEYVFGVGNTTIKTDKQQNKAKISSKEGTGVVLAVTEGGIDGVLLEKENYVQNEERL
jgi:hypothetical protein